MRHLLTPIVAIGLVAVFRLSGADAEGELSPEMISFRVVKTTAEPLVEVRTGKVVFLAPYLKLKIPPNDRWFGEGEIHPEGERVRWSNVKGFQTAAGLIAFNLRKHTLFEAGDANSDIPGLIGFRGASAKTGDAITICCAKTTNVGMVEIKLNGAVAVTPYLTFVSGRKKVEIRPIGDKLGWADGESTATFTSMSLDR